MEFREYLTLTEKVITKELEREGTEVKSSSGLSAEIYDIDGIVYIYYKGKLIDEFSTNDIQDFAKSIIKSI